MKRTSIKKILVMLILITIVAVLATNVKATSNPIIVQPGGSTTTNTTANTTANTTTNTTTTNTTTNTVRANVTTNTVSNYQNTNLPQTGDASDYVIFLFIAVCVVVAIFAYRKYKNYNI